MMNNGITGGILLLIAFILLILAFRQYRKKSLSDNTQTSRIKNIKNNLPAGIVEIKGRATCRNPLTARLSGKECIYYSYRIKELAGEAYLAKNNKTGRWSSIPFFTSQVACDGEMWADFEVQDSTGTIKVYGRGAEVCGIFTHDKMYAGSGEEMANLSAKVANTTWALNRRDKPVIEIGMHGQKIGDAALATKVLEEIIPNNCQIYILGKVVEIRGERVIMQDDSGSTFLISAINEEALVAQHSRRMIGYLAVSLTFAMIGLAFVLSYLRTN